MPTTTSRPQSFPNHRAWPPATFLAAGVVLAIETLRRAWLAIGEPGIGNLWAMLVGVALILVWIASRQRAMIVQDRVIRLEMHLRLDRLLGAARQADVARLRTGELVALRFAGDAELPALFEDVLAGKIATPDDIKRRVQDWQPDWLRV